MRKSISFPVMIYFLQLPMYWISSSIRNRASQYVDHSSISLIGSLLNCKVIEIQPNFFLFGRCMWNIIIWHFSLSIHTTKGTHEHLRNHTFLSGNFAPVRKEHVAVPVEVVEGEIPTSLCGAFLRNGPNPLFKQQKKRYHWFDGRKLYVF